MSPFLKSIEHQIYKKMFIHTNINNNYVQEITLKQDLTQGNY